MLINTCRSRDFFGKSLLYAYILKHLEYSECSMVGGPKAKLRVWKGSPVVPRWCDADQNV
jgi:hypothetical protein